MSPTCTQAILPVAGLGTRFLPWTKVIPKEMLPIGNQPIIAHLVDECLEAGINDICFVLNRGKESIIHYFFPDPQLEAELESRGKKDVIAHLKKYHQMNFHVVYQYEQLGDGHALAQAADWVRSDTVAVLFGDDFFVHDRGALVQLLDVYETLSEEERGVLFALESLDRDRIAHHGIVDPLDHSTMHEKLVRAKGLVEKPHPDEAPSSLGIVGRYIIPQSILKELPKMPPGIGGEVRLIDAFRKHIDDVPMVGYQCDGMRLDTGTPEGYKKAVQLIS